MVVSMVKPQVDASDMLELFLEWTPHDPRMYVGIPNFGPFLDASQRLYPESRAEPTKCITWTSSDLLQFHIS
jgi:hypothetical protein